MTAKQSPGDRELVDYVDRVARTGAKDVELPMSLVLNATAEGMKTVKQLCKLTGMKVKSVRQD